MTGLASDMVVVVFEERRANALTRLGSDCETDDSDDSSKMLTKQKSSFEQQG